MIGIYKISSPTGRIYIGQSVNIKKRFKEYSSLRNCKSQVKLYKSFLKHGVGKHLFEIIEECYVSFLNERERYYQELFDVIKCGLNLILTKDNSKSGNISEESRAKMIKNSAKFWKGKKLSHETKQKLSLAKIGHIPWNKGKNTFYNHICKICNTEFESRVTTSVICSAKCRNDNNRINIKKRDMQFKKKTTL